MATAILLTLDISRPRSEVACEWRSNHCRRHPVLTDHTLEVWNEPDVKQAELFHSRDKVPAWRLLDNIWCLLPSRCRSHSLVQAKDQLLRHRRVKTQSPHATPRPRPCRINVERVVLQMTLQKAHPIVAMKHIACSPRSLACEVKSSSIAADLVGWFISDTTSAAHSCIPHISSNLH